MTYSVKRGRHGGSLGQSFRIRRIAKSASRITFGGFDGLFHNAVGRVKCQNRRGGDFAARARRCAYHKERKRLVDKSGRVENIRFRHPRICAKQSSCLCGVHGTAAADTYDEIRAEIANRRNGTQNGFVRRVVLNLEKCFIVNTAGTEPFLKVRENGTVLIQVFAGYYKTAFSEFGIALIPRDNAFSRNNANRHVVTVSHFFSPEPSLSRLCLTSQSFCERST